MGKTTATKNVKPISTIEPCLVFEEFVEKMTKNERPSSPKFGNFFGKKSTIKRDDPLHDDDPNTFVNAIGSILLMAQFFGFLPISGIRSSSPNKFKFSKTSWRTLPTYSVIVGSFGMTMVYLAAMMKTFDTDSLHVQGGIADAIEGLVMHSNTFFGIILFLRLSPKWISLQRDWRAMELSIDKYGKRRPKLKWKFVLMTALIFFLVISKIILKGILCTPPDVWRNATFEEFLEVYTMNSRPFLMKHVNYNFAVGVFTFFMSNIAIFTSNFTDLFIILVSTGLAERYKQVNQRIENDLTGQFGPAEWKEFREYYALLSTMVKKVDREISSIIFLSFVKNMYFVCLQLLNGVTLQEDEGIIGTILFFGSVVFLLGRMISLILLTARVNDQSKVVLPFLFNCPRTAYTIEAQRLQVQLTTDEVAFTGLQFFSITRNFMLAVAGGLVTFEVVLLQFDLAMKK